MWEPETASASVQTASISWVQDLCSAALSMLGNTATSMLGNTALSTLVCAASKSGGPGCVASCRGTQGWPLCLLPPHWWSCLPLWVVAKHPVQSNPHRQLPHKHPLFPNVIQLFIQMACMHQFQTTPLPVFTKQH